MRVVVALGRRRGGGHRLDLAFLEDARDNGGLVLGAKGVEQRLLGRLAADAVSCFGVALEDGEGLHDVDECHGRVRAPLFDLAGLAVDKELGLLEMLDLRVRLERDFDGGRFVGHGEAPRDVSYTDVKSNSLYG